MTQRPTIPTATYRLQFHKGFNFQAARALVPCGRSAPLARVAEARFGPTHLLTTATISDLAINLGFQKRFDEAAALLTAP